MGLFGDTGNQGTALLCLALLGPLANAQWLGDRFLGTSIETIRGDGIELIDAVAEFREEAGDWRYELTLGGGDLSVDYTPSEFDIFGSEETLHERRVSGEAHLRRVLSPRWNWSAGVGGSDGFTGYRSLWISNWYQQFFAGLDGLEKPAPHAFHASLGGQWSYRPGSGLLESEFTWARETIAPGYDEVLDPVLGLVGVAPLRDTLGSLAWSVAGENVWTSWIRTRVEYQLASQSERELRHGLTLRANFSLSSRWFLRAQIGGAFERGGMGASRDFKAWWSGAELVWEASEEWAFDLGARYYRDNGEIENSIGFSSAAPGVDVPSLQVGMRYGGERHAARLAIGYREADYAPVGFRNLFFSGLYADRHYMSASATYQYAF